MSMLKNLLAAPANPAGPARQHRAGRAAAWACALALSLPGAVQATASASATVGSFTIEFFDLDPDDGISPAWDFQWQSTSAYASLQTQDGGFVGDRNSSPGFYAPLQFTVASALGQASATTGPSSTASGWTLGPGGGQCGCFSAQAEAAYGQFTLSPWTGIRLRMNSELSAAVSSLTHTEYAYSVARLYLSIADPGGG